MLRSSKITLTPTQGLKNCVALHSRNRLSPTQGYKKVSSRRKLCPNQIIKVFFLCIFLLRRQISLYSIYLNHIFDRQQQQNHYFLVIVLPYKESCTIFLSRTL